MKSKAEFAKRSTAPVPNTSALKALAHPDRLRILGMLRFDGPATASGLARRMGLNSGATSYHLRQLAEYGFIEPADDLGNRRDRWWRARQVATGSDPAELGAGDAGAAMAMIEGIITQHMALMQRAMQQFPDQPPEWQQASNVSDYTYVMTAEQASAFKETLTTLFWEEMRRTPADATESPKTRKFMVMLHAFPFPGFGGDSDP